MTGNRSGNRFGAYRNLHEQRAARRPTQSRQPLVQRAPGLVVDAVGHMSRRYMSRRGLAIANVVVEPVRGQEQAGAHRAQLTMRCRTAREFRTLDREPVTPCRRVHPKSLRDRIATSTSSAPFVLNASSLRTSENAARARPSRPVAPPESRNTRPGRPPGTLCFLPRNRRAPVRTHQPPPYQLHSSNLLSADNASCVAFGTFTVPIHLVDFAVSLIEKGTLNDPVDHTIVKNGPKAKTTTTTTFNGNRHDHLES